MNSNLSNQDRGYKIVKNKSKTSSGHFFGGTTWTLPESKICKESMHQILTLNVSEAALMKLENRIAEIPLFSCLNCSLFWDNQHFKVDFINKSATILQQDQEEIEQQDEEDRIVNPLPLISVALREASSRDNQTDDDTIDRLFSELGTDYIGRAFGKPIIAQDALDLTCISCGGEMQFIAQITGDNDMESIFNEDVDFFFGETMLYFSLCPCCDVLKVEPQAI